MQSRSHRKQGLSHLHSSRSNSHLRTAPLMIPQMLSHSSQSRTSRQINLTNLLQTSCSGKTLWMIHQTSVVSLQIQQWRNHSINLISESAPVDQGKLKMPLLALDSSQVERRRSTYRTNQTETQSTPLNCLWNKVNQINLKRQKH